MLIKTLVENTALSEEFGCEYGLSLYIETGGYKLLFDLGAGELFYENARKLGVDIAAVDFLVISHGHYDHGGGLRAFLRENTKAKVFLHRRAFDKYYFLSSGGKVKYIGLEPELKDSGQIVPSSDGCMIANGISLLSAVEVTEPLPASNEGLLMEREGQLLEDSFEHEQSLLIEEDGKTVLLTGCAHKGIVNIVEQLYKSRWIRPDYIIGGFHLFRLSVCHEAEFKTIEGLGRYLLETGASCYTCHCTGKEVYQSLKAVMGQKLRLPAYRQHPQALDPGWAG